MNPVLVLPAPVLQLWPALETPQVSTRPVLAGTVVRPVAWQFEPFAQLATVTAGVTPTVSVAKVTGNTEKVRVAPVTL